MKAFRTGLVKSLKVGQFLWTHHVRRAVVVLLEYETVLKSLFTRKPKHYWILPKVAFPPLGCSEILCVFKGFQEFCTAWLSGIAAMGQSGDVHLCQLGSDFTYGMKEFPAKVDWDDLIDEHSKPRLVVVAPFMIRGRS